MPRPNKLRLCAAVLALGLILLPAASAFAGSHRSADSTDDQRTQVRLVNPQLWALVFFTQLKVTLIAPAPTTAISPKPIAISPIPVKPDPDPDPNPVPLGGGGGGGGGGCSTCSGGGGGDSGASPDPNGG